MTTIRRSRHRATRRLTTLGATAAAALLALTACGSGGGGDSSADAGKPVSGGTLKVAFFPDNPIFKCIDPFQTYWIEHRSIIRNFADSLTDQDPDTGDIKPWLATSWEISKNGLTYTFHLKDGVTFSNGDKLDAQAVAANAQGWLDTVTATNHTAYGTSYILGLKDAKVVDPLTVQFDFTTPNSSFLQATSTTNLAIIDPTAYSETPQDRCLGKGLVGSGAFVLDHYTPDTETVLKKRTTPYTSASSLVTNQGDAYLDEVDYSYVAEDSVRTGNLLNGTLDIDWPRNPISPQDQAQMKASGDTVEARPLPGVSYTQWPNTSAGHPLSDPLVRKAVIAGTDLKTLAATVYGKDYPVVAGVFDSTTPGFKDESAKLAYDPSEAGKLLDQAGWTKGSDGYRTKNGQDLTLVIPATVFSAGNELFQAEMKEIGIKVDLHTLTTAEQATYLNDGAFDLTNNYFTRADPGALQFILNPDLANSKALATDISSPDKVAQIQALFTKAVQSTDPAQTAQAYDDLQDYVIDQAIALPLFERVQTAGVADDVHGFAFTSESFMRLNDVWKS